MAQIKGATVLLACLVVLLVLPESRADALWGAIQTGYPLNTKMTLMVNSFRSRRGLLPYNYFTLPFCKPDKERMRKERLKENLGEILMGNRVQPSLYNVTLGRNVVCQTYCEATFSRKQMKRANFLAENNYIGHMTLDGLPVVSPLPHGNIVVGYKFGVSKKRMKLEFNQLNNHLSFYINYTKEESFSTGKVTYSITSFSVVPKSVDYSEKSNSICNENMFIADESHPLNLPTALKGKATQTIRFTYSVNWIEDPNGEYTTRWDIYSKSAEMKRSQGHGHWMAAANSLLLVTLVGIAVAVVMTRTVRRDLIAYTDDETTEEMREETGWKLVRGDVFRAPLYPVILSAFIGSGCQFIVMIVGAIIAAGLGLLRVSRRGNLLTGMIFFFFLSSSISGYISARLLKFFKKQSWMNGFAAVMLCPSSIAAGYLCLNTIHWVKHSASAIPLGTCVFLLSVWFGCAVPLAFCGLAVGFRQEVLSAPTKISSIPRLIPEKAVGKSVYYILGGGIVPFSACFIEIVYVLAAFWQGDSFYKMGYLVVVGVIIAVLCAEVSIVVTYVTLSSEDYRWWWRSFLSLASSGLYLFFYSLLYLKLNLELRLFSSVVLFAGYMLGVSLFFGLITGTVGFLASAWFVRLIYAASKAD